MAGRLTGKRVLVTAAAQGIGRAIAIAMAREGAMVLATDINTTPLVELEAEQNLTTEVLDVTNAAQLASLAKEQAAFDVLVNVAGFVHHGSILECAEQDYEFSMSLNVKSMYHTIRAFLPACWTAAAAASSTWRRSPRASKGCPIGSSTAPARRR